MASVFIKVPVSDRLPDKDGYYFALGKHGSKRILFFDFETGFCERVSYWFEEIEIPTEQDIDKLGADFACTHIDSAFAFNCFMHGSNFILDKLKGGNNG